MRAGACTSPQTLTSEAASALKHSLSLARRRGHAQVTPLHVAATLLSSRASLLRRACLKSQPHNQPLHSRALELCFNVALNRLPTAPGPLLHGQPSLSNALIAALKRAQAHQRRGCIEQQQQPQLLAIKVELEQLILSILDDPSVSRVMREAGFSSTLVKNNIEDSPPVFHSYTTSGGVYSSPSSPSRTPFFQNPFLSPPPLPLPNGPNPKTVDDNMKIVLELLLRNEKGKGKNAVIIGDSVSVTERLVLNMIEKVEMHMVDMPEEIRSTRFVIFKVSEIGLRLMRREEVEMKVSELKRKVEYYSLSSRGVVIIYVGDMKWIVDNNNNNPNNNSNSGFGDGDDGYSPVDHLVEEIGKMVSTAKVSLMATANYQTYMRCQMRQPPLELQWSLQAVSVPSGGLGLSLNATSVHESRMTFSHNPLQLLEKQETCCAECTINYEKEATMFKSGHHKPSSLYASSWSPKNTDNGSNPNPLPCWLQSHGSELRERDNLGDLRRKWNTLCHNLHQGKHTQNHMNSSLSNNQSIIGKNYSYASSYPWWPNPNPNPNSPFPEKNSISFADSSSMPRFRRQQSCHIEFSFSNGNQNHKEEPNLDCLKSREGKELKITLALGNGNGNGNSVFSDSGKMGGKDICRILLENVPWQSDSIPSIAESLIDSRVLKKRETWLLIEGNDGIGKKRLGRGIAESVFGSADLFFSMNMRRENEVEKLEMALRNHEKLVVLVEDVDFADTQLVKFLKGCLGSEKIDESCEKERGFGQKIFILTKGGDARDYFDGGKKNQEFSVVQMKLVVNKVNSDHKRRPEWDLSNETKIAKINDKNDEHSSLDLNIKANGDEDEEREEKPTIEFSPISSDLTRETANDLSSGPLGFLESIRNRFVFNRDSDKDSQIREMFLSKIRLSFEEVFGSGEMGGLIVEQVVLDEVLLGCGSFLNGVFGKWLKDVFQTSLESVKIGGTGGLSIRLCLGGGQGDNEGFMGSNLPKEIQLSFMH